MSPRAARAILLFSLLAAACSRGSLPPGDGSSDSGISDGGVQDAGGHDAGVSDAGDAGAHDAGVSDAGSSDAGPADGGAHDAGPRDAGAADGGEHDAGSSDAGSSDAGSSDAGSSDAGASDAGANDGGTSDAGPLDGGSDGGAHDAGPSDAGAHDAGSNDAGAGDAGADAGTPSDGGLTLREETDASFPLDPALAQCGLALLDSFESQGELASWQAANWADVTLDSSGNPAQLSLGASGATDGAQALQFPARFTGAGYHQGYVGRGDLALSLAGCASLAIDVTLPAGAPANLRGALILLLGADAAWNGQNDPVSLTPGATVTVRLPLAGGILPVPERALLHSLAGLGFKIDGADVTWSGMVSLDNLRVEPMRGPTDDDTNAAPVGTYGGFIEADGGVDIPTRNGFLTFTADTTVQGHALRWPMLNQDGSDFVVGTAYFNNTSAARSTTPFLFHDWTHLEAQATLQSGSANALLSRSFPAARYASTATSFLWNSSASGRAPMSQMAVVHNGQIEVHTLSNGATISLSDMSEPWIVLWAGAASGWSFDVPVLFTFQHRPSSAKVTSQGVTFQYASAMGGVNAMPLFGLARQSTSDTAGWDSGLPGDVIVQSRAFVPILAAYPDSLLETSAVDDAAGTVTISDTYTYQSWTDDWGTQAAPTATLPPAVYYAGLNGYPVTYPDGVPTQSEVATWFGPYAYLPGPTARYTIPLPHGLLRSPVAVRMQNSAAAAPIRTALEDIITTQLPTEPGTYWLGNDESDADFVCDAFATLEPGSDVRAFAQSIGPRLAENAFTSIATTLFTEPVTGQPYLVPTYYPEYVLPFDKEWNTGRQLASAVRCAEAVDLDLARGLWPKLLATYRYHRIFFDWATGSVVSSTFGINELSDGIHFAWDGQLGIGRLARKLGDEATYRDVAYRTARQQLALYHAWFQPQWVKQLDYGIGHISNARLPNDQIETRGAIDGYVEEYGCATLELKSFWQTTNYLYFDIPAQLSLYRDYGLEDRVQALEYQIMPALHSSWTDGNAMDPVDQRYYGSNYTAAHLIARALLFHDDPAALFADYNGVQGTASASQWYTIFFHGISGPTLLSLERAKAPLIEAPLGAIRLGWSSYDAAANLLWMDLQALRTGTFDLRTRAPGGAFQDHPLQLTAGKRYTLSLTP